MNRALAIGGLMVTAAAGALAWGGSSLFGATAAPAAAPAATRAIPPAPPRAPAAAPTVDGVESVDVEGQGGPIDAGLTPMARRVAVLGLLNKRNGVSRDVTMRPGQALRVGDVVIRLRACEQTAPWEADQLTGAFVQLDVQGVERGWRRVFSGWLYKERPALNVVLHPIYDVWAKSCAMTFPGPTPVASAAATRPSSARKSPAPARGETEATPAAAPASPDTSDSAAPSAER